MNHKRRCRHLPRERLLAEIHVPVQLTVADGATELISETTGTASADTSSTDALLHLLVDKALDVGPSREHLDTR